MTTLPRPLQVTAAGWVAVGGSVIAVLTSFSAIASLHTLKTRQSIESSLSTGPGRSLGLSVDDVLGLVRVGAMVTAVCGAATAVLGVYVLRCSRGSRLALSLVAVPMFVAGLLSGGVATAMVVAAAATLWLPTARRWFDGVPAPARPVHPALGPGPATPALHGLPPPTGAPIGAGPTAGPHPGGPPGARPAAVIWTCVITWCVATFVLLVFGEALVELAIHGQRFLDQMHQQNPDLASEGVSDTELRVLLYVICALAMAWALAAAWFAVLAWRRVRWGATALLAVTILVGGLGLLLLRPEARRWYGR